MAKNRLRANICGTTYTFVSDETLSYMRDLAASVDADMSKIMSHDPHISTTMAAVLTAVQNADKACKEAHAADDLRLKLKHMVDDAEHLKDQLCEARANETRLTKELMELRTAYAAAATPQKPKGAPKTTVSFEEILDEDDT